MRCAISPLPTMQHSRQSLPRSSGSTGTSTCTASAPRYPWSETNRVKCVAAVANIALRGAFKFLVANEAIMPPLPPTFPRAYPIDQYPCRTRQAASIMLMIMNNLDPAVAQVSLKSQLLHPKSGVSVQHLTPVYPPVPPGARHLRRKWPGLQ